MVKVCRDCGAEITSSTGCTDCGETSGDFRASVPGFGFAVTRETLRAGDEPSVVLWGAELPHRCDEWSISSNLDPAKVDAALAEFIHQAVELRVAFRRESGLAPVTSDDTDTTG